MVITVKGRDVDLANEKLCLRSTVILSLDDGSNVTVSLQELIKTIALA